MIEKFKAKVYASKDSPGAQLPGEFFEIGEAADVIEDWLLKHGKPQTSFGDIFFNGFKGVHSSIYYLTNNTFGFFNAPDAPWPLEYLNLGQFENDLWGREIDKIRLAERADKDVVDKEAKKLDLGAGESPKTGKDASDGDEQDADEGEGEPGESEDGEGDKEEDTEMPRLKLFGKFRGPHGWRKRAESDVERSMNSFEWIVGTLKEDERTPRQQERYGRRLVTARFIETEGTPEGELQIILPQDVEFVQRGQRWVARIPLHEH
jgi:hypothetical protein